MNEYKKQYDSLWNEYLKQRWSRQRLRLYGGKKRVFSKFFNTIKSFDVSRRVVIAYGSAKIAPGGTNEISVPTTRSFKECQMTFPTIVVDEFRTTKIYHEDNSILQYIKRRDQDKELRGLLWCSSTNLNKFVNRDQNAAINIRRCALSPKRPTILQRSPNNIKLPKVIGKYIKH
jgi:transposase